MVLSGVVLILAYLIIGLVVDPVLPWRVVVRTPDVAAFQKIRM